ncbi:MAG TPA: carboxypeptidase regulatory-like domain-containing protein [Bryobacteraceae bacterium]|nr:carboxypeptidase regulatory-like domain-containing protein [Bryobacteraceae bacterium]
MTRIVSLFALACTLSFAQGVSSSVNGILVDPSDAALPGGLVKITNEGTGATETASSGSDGRFVFPIVAAGTYTLESSGAGFKTLRISGIAVSSSQIRSVGRLTMQIGEVREAVNVTAEAALLQLSSAEKSGVLTGTQINNLALKGRDFFALMQTIPGVVDTNTSREATTTASNANIYINGARDNQKNFTVDGVTAHDTHSNGSMPFMPNMDSISEVRVLTSNYQAEYGRNAGGAITAITKSGSREFHGTAYDYYRHETLNANDFFNNRTGTQKAPYRYRISGYTIGGPVFVPKVFNTSKEKFFFFWSQEYTGVKRDYGVRFINTPTELERNGDFSRSFDVNGALITIRDPLTGQLFPGNIIPQNRFNQLGRTFLNFMPVPNYTDPDPRNRYRWNYRSQYSGGVPRRNDIVRTDANLSPSFRLYYRFGKDRDNLLQPWNSWQTGNINYFLTPVQQIRYGLGHVVHATKIFSPTLVNETIYGYTNVSRDFDLLDKSLVGRGKMGNPPQWYPDPSEYSDHGPNISFGSIPVNAVNFNLQANLPNRYRNPVNSLQNNLSKVLGSHSIKAGIYVERTYVEVPFGGNVRGSFNFGRDVNNPFDTGNGFSNALLGQITSYSEAQLRVNSIEQFWNYEWYAQDNWKVSRRLTVDLGMRFYVMPPIYDVNHMAATFDPALFDKNKVPALYQPAFDVSGRRVARDPITGKFAAAPLIGQFVPNTGDPSNGSAVGGENGYPRGLYTRPPVSFGPRFGLAYDLFGDGRTALRTGFGLFYDVGQNNPFANAVGNPPLSYTPTLYYGNLDTYAQGGGAIGPSNLNILYGEHKLPSTMNFSFGIQRQLRDTVIDVSYVGALSRHLYLRRNMNPIAIGARFDQNNFDTTQSGRPLPDNFYRPYKGYGDLFVQEHSGTSNYNSLQVSANKRFSHGLQFGVSYSWAKALGTADSDTSLVSSYFPARAWNYGPPSYDRTHTLVVNYLYELPKVGTRLGWTPAKWVFDNWQISGITSMITGAPFTPGFTTTDAAEITGSSEAARITVIGNPHLDEGQRNFFRNFNTAAFARTTVGSFGNAGVNILRGPGINNWDVNITKRVQLFSESRFVQFRTELFNAWNHTQFSGLYTTARFDANGNQVDPNFGAYSASRAPRTIQLSLRVVF